jgi:hypothetical protein
LEGQQIAKSGKKLTGGLAELTRYELTGQSSSDLP